MLNYADRGRITDRKQMEYVISRYFKFMPKFVRSEVIKEMVELDLLKKLNNHQNPKLEVINVDKSKHIDKLLLAKIIQAGNKD